MIGRLVPSKTEIFLGRTIHYWTAKDGSRSYILPDGREVKVWQEYQSCLRCGKPLKSARSKRSGYGPCCKIKKNPFAYPIIQVLIVVSVNHANPNR